MALYQFISTYNPIYEMYNPISNQLFHHLSLVNGHDCIANLLPSRFQLPLRHVANVVLRHSALDHLLRKDGPCCV